MQSQRVPYPALIAAIFGWLTLCFSVMPAVAASSPKFGKTLAAEYNLPKEAIDKFAAFKPSKADKGSSAVENVLMADTETWNGPPLKVTAKSNPYTVAVTITGVALADGDMVTLWQKGWGMGDGATRLDVIAGLSKTGVRAGQRVTLTAASPNSFKDDRETALSLALVNAKNINFESVQVQVWSGLANPTFMEILMSLRWALVGVVFIAVWLVMKRL